MPETAEKTGVEITLGDGTKIVGTDVDDALKNAAKMIEDNKKYAREQKERAETAERERTTLATQIEANKPKPQPKNGEFDNARYYELLNTEPIAAQNMLDAYRFGIPDPNQVPQVFIGMSQAITNIEQQNVSATFLAMHADEFSQDEQTVKAMTQRVAHLVNNEGFKYGLKTLNYAWDELVKEGAVKPLEKKSDDDQSPNPSLSGTGSTGLSDAEQQKIDKMTPAELEAYGRAKGWIS